MFTIAGTTTLYLGGDFSTVDGSARAHLAAVSVATGSLQSWSPTANDQVRSLKLIAGNRLIAGGNFTQVNGSSANHLAALSPDHGCQPAVEHPRVV